MTNIDWMLLGRYAAGECTDEERAAVEVWLAESPVHRVTIRAIGRVRAQGHRTASVERQTARFARLRSRLEAEVPRRSATVPRWSFAVMRIAAGVILVLGVSFAAYRTLRRPNTSGGAAQPTVHTISTARGQRMSLRLADGTLVLLAPASTLRFAGSYGTFDRAVRLEGEAAFTVTHDEQRPFSVQTRDFVARDLGTQFVVRAYADDSVAHVVVAEGEVAVARHAGEDSVMLSPGDHAQLAATPGVTLTHRVLLDRYFGWTEGRLVFRRTRLADAIREIERWHDVEIRLASPALATLGFSASFDQGESAAEMLHVVGAVLELDVTQTSRRTYLLRAGRPTTRRPSR